MNPRRRQSIPVRFGIVLGLMGLLLLVDSLPNAALPTFQASVEPEIRSPVRLLHRGRFYDVADLMDPAFRAESDDPFVRSFNPDQAIADVWAGGHVDDLPEF
jgi:hypothetical protein